MKHVLLLISQKQTLSFIHKLDLVFLSHDVEVVDSQKGAVLGEVPTATHR